MKCESCGKQTEEGWSVCPSCGHSAGVSEAVLAVPGDVARGVANASVEVATTVVKATEHVAQDVADAGKQLGRETEKVVTSVGDELKPNAPPAAPKP